MTNKKIEYTKRLLAFADLPTLVESLENTNALPDAFFFHESPQGQDFWWDQYERNALTPEGREALLDIIRAKRESIAE